MSSEKSVLTVQALVMVYNNTEKSWTVAGESEGNSKVQIFHHPTNNTYRVIARKLVDHELVINSAIIKSTKYNRATETFHQWRDKQLVFGLNFFSPSDADSFGHAFEGVLSFLTSVGSPVSLLPAPTSNSTVSHTMNNLSIDDSSVHNRANQAPMHSTNPYGTMKSKPSQSSIPQAPPSQPPPQPPPIIHPTPVGDGGVPAPPPGGIPPPPPPPPPPPGPSSAPFPAAASSCDNGSPDEEQGGMGGLAAAIAAAKLKKTNKESGTGSASSGGTMRGNGGGGGGGGGMDMMSEMARKLQLRKAKADAGRDSDVAPSHPTPSTPGPPPFSGSLSQSKTKTSTPWKSKASTSTNHLSKTSTTTSVPNLNATPGEQAASTSDLESFKQAILSEMRVEMKKIKEEIIDAIKQELPKK